MSNGEVCCILGVCCPSGGQAQFEHLVALVQKSYPKMSNQRAHEAALKVLEAHGHFQEVKKILDEFAAATA